MQKSLLLILSEEKMDFINFLVACPTTITFKPFRPIESLVYNQLSFGKDILQNTWQDIVKIVRILKFLRKRLAFLSFYKVHFLNFISILFFGISL